MRSKTLAQIAGEAFVRSASASAGRRVGKTAAKATLAALSTAILRLVRDSAAPAPQPAVED